MWKAAAVLLATGMLAGCSTYSTDRYSISADNVVALRSLKDHKVAVGEFTSSARDSRTGADLSEIMCRGVGPIKTPDNESFADYIKKAVIAEMKMAEIYAPGAPTVISGNLGSIDFSSTSGYWDMGLTLKSSNGRSITVHEKYPYGTSFFLAVAACDQTAQAFMPAVQDLVGKAVRSNAFKNLIAQ